ncbi:MAG TPA: hypothetical protein VH419_09450, partial [Nocardioidaceae bacterium]
MAGLPRSVRVPRNPVARALRRSGLSAVRQLRVAETTWLVVLCALALLMVLCQREFPEWWPLT